MEIEITVPPDEFLRLRPGGKYKLPPHVIDQYGILKEKVHDFRFVRFIMDKSHKVFDFEGVTSDYRILLGDKSR